MVRLACINIPRVDLQVLVLRHPDWKQLPAAVVTEENPLGRITAVNRAAQRSSVRPGMRYASALSICPELRAGVVMPEEREDLKTSLTEILRQFSPDVEPSSVDGALFWVNAAGLQRLYPTLATWAGALQTAVQGEDLVCSIAVGFSRFGTYAAAKSKRALTIFESEDQERAEGLRAPVGVLPIDHDVLLRFHQLGILTIRDFNRFSSGALRRRFGREIERLQLFARGDEALPLQSAPELLLLQREMRLLYPEGSAQALLHHLHMLTAELIHQAWSQQELVAEIVISLCPEYWPGSMDECAEEILRSAKPSSDPVLWDRLLRLRFETITLAGPIVRLAVQVKTAGLEHAQSDLFAPPPKRDPQKALSAIADICAELGNDAVQVARLHNDLLPQAQFSWNRVDKLLLPQPEPPGSGGGRFTGPLIRRILHKPVPISEVEGADKSANLKGPYLFSGGWWEKDSLAAADSPGYQREYYYLEDASGRLLWIYHDLWSHRWMLQGVVE